VWIRTGDHPELNSLFLAEMMYQLNVLQEQKLEHEAAAAAAAAAAAQDAEGAAGVHARRTSGELQRRHQSLGHVRSLLFGDTDPNDPAFAAMRAMGQRGAWGEQVAPRVSANPNLSPNPNPNLSPNPNPGKQTEALEMCFCSRNRDPSLQNCIQVHSGLPARMGPSGANFHHPA